jgi:hypothetical protein
MAPDAPSGVRVLGKGWLSVVVIPTGNALSSPSPLLHILLNSAAPVHGTWGSGRLLRTSLFSVLITSNGKALIGAVTPDVLYADAAKVK